VAFTYSSTMTNNVSKIRFVIGDVTEDAGILPSGANFSDAELTGLVTLYGTWQAAALFACRAAAAQWASKASSVSIGDYSEARQQVTNLTALAKTLEETLPGAAAAAWSGTGMGLGASTVENIAVVE
jgi:hypothetical protein